MPSFGELFSYCVAILAVVLSWASNTRNVKRDIKTDTEKAADCAKEETKTIVEMQTTIQIGFKDIKDSINDVRLDIRNMRDQNSQMFERLVKVEESNKSLQKRLEEHIRKEE